MAIAKITFTNGSTKADQYSDMLSFLQTYATPYFSSITGDSETGVISCRLAGRSYDSLTLYCNSSSNLVSFKWYTQESGTTNDGLTYTGSYKFSYAVVTSKGFYICWFVNTSKPKQPSFFVITKDKPIREQIESALKKFNDYFVNISEPHDVINDEFIIQEFIE